MSDGYSTQGGITMHDLVLRVKNGGTGQSFTIAYTSETANIDGLTLPDMRVCGVPALYTTVVSECGQRFKVADHVMHCNHLEVVLGSIEQPAFSVLVANQPHKEAELYTVPYHTATFVSPSGVSFSGQSRTYVGED